MLNLMSFLNYFTSYLAVFLIIAALVVFACFLGVKWRRSKDAQNAALESSEKKA